MSFEWFSGAYPEECSYSIVYTDLEENNKQTTISEENPSEGEKNLSICQ
tara:strand:+ start:454 stop:600 length:147 start_codon:yes stop_codon:yes gene_type:complete